MDIRSLGYIVIESNDLDRWRHFACDVLGMMLNRDLSDKDSLYLKMDDRPFRVLVRSGEVERFAAAGWQLAGPDAFETALAELDQANIPWILGSESECAARRVHGFTSLRDPSGNLCEIYHGTVLDHTPFLSPMGVSEFVTGEMGLGHIVLPAAQYEDTYRFYTSMLGFRLSDTMRLGPISLSFLHCNPRHHSVALMGSDVPSGLVHFMIEMGTLNDVGYTLDRVHAADLHLSASLGLHPNDQMTSFYVRSPAGFDVEVGCGGIQVDDSTWTTAEITVPSLWGHKGLGQ